MKIMLQQQSRLSKETDKSVSRFLSQQLDISSKSAHTIPNKKLSMHPYKMQIFQKLHEGDFERRVAFCEWFLQKHADNANFNQTLIMSDETHFELNGSVNKQNIRFRAEENPKESTEISFHSERVTVWCGISVPISLKMGMDKQLQ